MKYDVWYMRPEFFRDGCMGYDWLGKFDRIPRGDKLRDTHVYLMTREARGLDDLFIAMQGENWSPNGEAFNLIEEKGLQHTSMMVGDVAVEFGDGHKPRIYMVDTFGFRTI